MIYNLKKKHFSTFEKAKPILPVPQQISNIDVSLVGLTKSIAVWYSSSAPAVFTWKKASGDTWKVIPNSVSSIYLDPLRCSIVHPPFPSDSLQTMFQIKIFRNPKV